MVSFLSVPLFERPIDGLRDLAKQGDLRVGGWSPELKGLFVPGNVTEKMSRSVLDEAREILAKRYEVG